MIGKKIRELRYQRGLTQEQVASRLYVSVQAVSKWECGISTPDLSMIGPLTRLFDVTADELLGLTETEQDKRRMELDAAYEMFLKNAEWQDICHLAAEAIRDDPENFRCLEWLANAKYQLALADDVSAEYFEEMMDDSMRHYERITENCQDPIICEKAHHGILRWLKITERTIEAEWYEEMVYPGKICVTD